MWINGLSKRGLFREYPQGALSADAQVLEDAERLIAGWNERQAKRMPMLFSPTIGAAIRRASSRVTPKS
jgi:hypothetical protein